VLPHAHWPDLELLPPLFPWGVGVPSATRLSELPPEEAAHIPPAVPVRQAIAIMKALDAAYLAALMSKVSVKRWGLSFATSGAARTKAPATMSLCSRANALFQSRGVARRLWGPKSLKTWLDDAVQK
jgi:hypothetical protein